MNDPKGWKVSACTETTEGAIPHLYVPYADGYFRAPVKLRMERELRKDSLYPPMSRDGHLVYVLPGGLEYVN